MVIDLKTLVILVGSCIWCSEGPVVLAVVVLSLNGVPVGDSKVWENGGDFTLGFLKESIVEGGASREDVEPLNMHGFTEHIHAEVGHSIVGVIGGQPVEIVSWFRSSHGGFAGI